MNKNKELLLNTIILGFGQFIPKIIGIITLPILTKYLSVSDYGFYDLFISFSSLFIPIFTLLIQQGAYRYLITEKDNQIKKEIISSSFFSLHMISTLLFLILMIGCILAPLKFPVCLLIFLLYFSESLYDFLGQVVRGIGKNLTYSIGAILFSAFNMLFLLLSIRFNWISLYSTILIVTISYLCATFFLYFKAKIQQFISWNSVSLMQIKKLLKYSMPIIPSSISLWIVNLSDRLLITIFLGASYNGIYAAACKIPNFCNSLYNIFNLAWTETAVKTVKEKNIAIYYSNLFKNLFLFLVSCILFLISLSPIFYKILIDEKLFSGYYQLPILFLGILFSCLTSFYGAIYVALEKTKKVGLSSFAGALINFVINLCLMKYIGLYSASLSTAISFLIIFIYRGIDIHQYLKLNYEKKEILIATFLTILFYWNKWILLIVGFIISAIYCWKYNFIFKYCLNKLKKRSYKEEIK